MGTATKRLYLVGSAIDADANGKTPDFPSLGRGRFVCTAEVPQVFSAVAPVETISATSIDMRLAFK